MERINSQLNKIKKEIGDDVFDRIYFDVKLTKTVSWKKYGIERYFTRVYVGRTYNNTKTMISSKANQSIDIQNVVGVIVGVAEMDLRHSKEDEKKSNLMKKNQKKLDSLMEKFDVDYRLSVYALETGDFLVKLTDTTFENVEKIITAIYEKK